MYLKVYFSLFQFHNIWLYFERDLNKRIIMEHLYCELCELQFDKQVVFDLHLSIIHKDNQINNGSPLSKEESVGDIKEKTDEDIKEEALEDTGKSLSEALIFASTNPQYNNRLFIELQNQYRKIPR
jgi:hypothetical protein